MTPAQIEQCRRDGALLYAIVADKVKLKRSGNTWKGSCPFHPDKTPSFTLFANGGFHCFGCQARGTSFDFVMKTENVDFATACRQIENLKDIKPAEAKPKTNGHAKKDEDWHPMVPPPVDAPLPTAAQLRCDMLHEYPGPDSELLFYVRRHEARGATGKYFLPLTYGVLNGHRGWHDRAPDKPRPLYGLDFLALAGPSTRILLCEGEKAADAARRLFRDAVCLSWMGGANGDAAADLTPLAGRAVILWGDADEVGQSAVARLAKRLPGARMVDVEGLADGFDAADLEAAGEADPAAWLEARLRDSAPKEDEAPALDLDPTLIAELLSAKSILAMDIPPPEPLLGSLVTKSTRAFLVGPTGLGKTMLGYSIAAGMAGGQGFLHWRSARRCRVLVFDGEMPGDLVQVRLRDALRRAGMTEPPDGLFFYSLDMIEQLAKQCPYLGQMAPLCTNEGQRFVMALCGALKVDAVIFDNLMSLLGTAALEPEKWEATLPLVAALTANRIGQLWLDHTNKAGGQYGTGTKAWRFDTVGVMAPLEAADRRGDDVAFTLSFDDPGKARRRTPANRSDYERVVIRLRDDVWTSEPADSSTLDKVKPSRRIFHEALLDILPAGSALFAETTLEAWRAACLRKGLIEPEGQTAPFRTAKHDLIVAGWIIVNGETVINNRRRSEATTGC